MAEINYEEMLGIKIGNCDVDAHMLVHIKKMTGDSIHEIKNHIEADDYIFKCDICDDDGLHQINVMGKELVEMGAKVVLYQCGREVSSTMLDTLEETYKEINQGCDMRSS